MKTTIVSVLLLFFCSVARAQVRPDISVKGFIDGYYSYNFNTPPQTADNTYRYYDTEQNQMNLNLAELSLLAKTQEVSFIVDFDFGPFADLNATTSPNGSSQIDESSKNIGQAVVSYRPSNSHWQIDAGKMYSHIGLETVKSKDNFNYSRSILFGYGMPFWHTGLRIGYDLVPDKLQTSLYIYNGWNSNNDVNRSKSFGAQMKWTPNSKSTFVYNILSGPEKASNERDARTVHEANATYALDQLWTFAADIIYGSEENAAVNSGSRFAKWYGGLITSRYQLTSTTFISPRYEYYRDDDGYTLGAGPQTLNSFTMTYGHQLSQGLETRAELRHEISSRDVFDSSSTQTTALVALLLQI